MFWPSLVHDQAQQSSKHLNAMHWLLQYAETAAVSDGGCAVLETLD